MNLKKISIRIEPDVLTKIDSLVDHLRIRNRSDAIRHLVKNAMGNERIAVILAKGKDKGNNIIRDLQIPGGTFAILEKVTDKTLAEIQLDLLTRAGFTRVYYIMPDIMLKGVKKILGNKKGLHYIENNNLRSMDALRLLNINSDFLVFYSHDLPLINLAGIFEEHVQKNNYVTLNLTWGHKEAKNYIEVDGTRIVDMEERSTKLSHLTYNAAFVANNKFLKEKGHSVVYDVFPRLANAGKMNGFISSKRVLRLRKPADKKTLRKELAN